jgi:hypothetical protein
MRRLLVVIVTALASTALAADVKLLQSSQGVLVGAVNGALDDPLGTTQHIPGYGFNMAGRPMFGDKFTADKAVEGLVTVLTALGGTLQGLDPGDWISVGFKTDDYPVLVRMKPGDPKTLEVFVDGVKRP